MIHEVVVIVYRLMVLIVLACTVWSVLDKETDGYCQVTAAILAIPLALRVLMIK